MEQANGNQGRTNQRFLATVDHQSKQGILKSIAEHYGIITEQAYLEVIDSDAEALFEYMIEPTRSATYGLMVRYGFV